MITFATEEEKNKAIEEFDERTGDVGKLDDILNAEIQKPETGDSSIDQSTDIKPEDTAKTDVKAEPEGDGQAEIKPDIAELEAKLAEKETYIKENLGQIGNLKILEEKIAKMEKDVRQEEKTQPKVELRESKLTDIVNRRTELLKEFPNPEDQLDGEYIKKMNVIQQDMLNEMANMQHNMTVVQDQASKATEKADNYISKREADDYKKRQESALDTQMREVEDFSKKHDEFKLSKPFKEVDSDYKDYERSVARIYFGRDAKNVGEVNEAMNQLRRRSPHLLGKLSAAGISSDLTDDFKKMLGLCEVWDYWQAFRKDPITGDFHRNDKGEIIQLTRYNPETGERIPDVYPSMDSAYNDKATKEGYYMKQLVAAKIKGGKDAMSAMSQRDGGATELGVTETQGGVLKTQDEVLKRINEIDEIQAVKMAQAGDPSLLNEYNQLAKTIEWPTVDIV